MKQYREYMDGIQASDTFHWRLLNLEAHKCRPRRLVRAVLVAACLCTTLIGGAFAIQLIGGDFRTINFYEHEWCPPPPGREDVIGQSFSGYVLWGGAITFFPSPPSRKKCKHSLWRTAQISRICILTVWTRRQNIPGWNCLKTPRYVTCRQPDAKCKSTVAMTGLPVLPLMRAFEL